MAPDSRSDNTALFILEAQIRDCYGRVVWTHKTQEKCADILLSRHHRIKIAQIVLSALTTTGILLVIFGINPFAYSVASAGVSALLLVLNIYTKDYDLVETAQKHINSAAELWAIRESYLSLLTDIRAGLISVADVSQKRNELQERLAAVYTGSPRTNDKAYRKATNALKKSEELTFLDKEINAFLPKELHKTEEN
jgi:hypothetical protein